MQKKVVVTTPAKVGLKKPQIPRGTGMVPATQIGERLVQVLEARRITAAQACLKAGLSRDTARNLIRGRAKEPRPSMLGLLADALEVDIKVLRCELPLPDLKPFPPKPPRAKSRRVDTSVPTDADRAHLPEFGFQDPDLRPHLQQRHGTWSIPLDAVVGRGVEIKDLVIVRSPLAIPELGVRRRDRLLVDTAVTFVMNGWVVGKLEGMPWAGKVLKRRIYAVSEDNPNVLPHNKIEQIPEIEQPKIYGQIVAVLHWLD